MSQVHPASRLGPHPDLDEARAAAAICTACDLYAHATQTVFGEGRRRAPLMLVGEQPGDREDLAGHPFVGRLGRSWTAPWSTPGLIANACS